ncbi:MAG: hypothetical protein RIC95_12665 [Vicingaceae bacterium]
MGKFKIPHLVGLLFSTIMLFLMPHLLLSQEEEVDKYGRDIEELTLKKRGPNLDQYSHIFLAYGFLVGPSENDSAEIVGGSSSSFMLGYLFKWRMTSWYELGFSATYHYSSFHLKQDSSKVVPNRELHRQEKIVFNNIQVAPFQRFKIRNRYHSTGTFIDLGGYFGYHYRTKHQTRENNRNPGTRRTRTVNLGLKYTENLSYGVLARVGFNRLMLYGRYRFSDLFTDESGLPELPRFEFGLKIGIHQ